MPTELEYAWCAGFIDGEGCFTIRVVNSGLHLMCEVSAENTDIRSMFKLHELLGGQVYDRGFRALGSKSTYSWRITGRKAGILAKRLLPYLVIKKERAELVAAFADTISSTVKPTPSDVVELRHELRGKLMAFNKKGAA